MSVLVALLLAAAEPAPMGVALEELSYPAPGVGHAPHLEAPEAFRAAVLPFLR